MAEPRRNYSESEWQARVDLAAAYRLMDHFGVRDLTYNHLSARVPDQQNAILIKRSDYMFGEITASNLLKFDVDGNSLDDEGAPLKGGGLVIHAGIMKLRPDIGAVFHTHTVANMAVAAQSHGLLPLTQHALMFHGRISSHAFEGFEFEPGMDRKLVDDLGSNNVAVLQNHGALVVGRNVPEAFVIHHFYEVAAQAQVAALSGGTSVIVPSEEICNKASETLAGLEAAKDGGKNWQACLRLADKLFPDFRS